jgi:hypothetical protein
MAAPNERRARPSLWRCLLLALLTSSASDPARANDGDWFTDVAAEVGIDFTHFNGMTGEYYMLEINGAGCGMLDYDGDGDLDLYLVQGSTLGPGGGTAATTAQRGPFLDRLLRNDLVVTDEGERILRFTDVTEESGIRAGGYGFGVAVGDYDNDGFPDLYVTNFGSNQLWRNRGDGTFENVVEATGTDDPRWSVPAAFFDYDRDGWLDLYVGSYVHFTLENHKVCRTAAGAQDYCGPNAYAPVSDRLFRNRGDGTFEDVSAKSGLQRELTKALGVVIGDFNGDGWLDLYVANDGTANQMWIHQHDGRFVDEALLAGTAFNVDGHPEASMGVDAADFDNDGDEDLFMTHLVAETNTIYTNDGSGMFEDTTVRSGLGAPSWSRTSWGTRFIDVDNDGWLDLLVVSGAVRTIEELARKGDPYPFHEPNQLFRNLGGGSFEEVTAQAGGVFELSEVSRGAAFGDVDNDGDTDVLILNNNGPVRLLRNDIGQASRWLGLRLVGRGDPPRDMLGAWVAVERPGRATLWRRAGTAGSFASANDPRVLVGLGDDATRPRVRVVWPDGASELFSDLAVGRYTTLRQGAGAPSTGSGATSDDR